MSARDKYFGDVKKGLRAITAEFVAMSCFVYIGCGTVMGTLEPGAGGPAENITTVSLAFGLAITVLVHTVGHISGAHLNPAVTFGLTITGKIKPALAVCYVLAQMVGAIVGSALLYSSVDTIGASCNSVANTSEGKAFVREAVLTFLLLLTVCATIDPSRDLHSTGSVAIGFAVAVAHLTSVTRTGTSINPARSFGPAVITGGDCWDSHWVWWLGPLLGATLASLLYKHVLAGKEAFSSTDVYTAEREAEAQREAERRQVLVSPAKPEATSAV